MRTLLRTTSALAAFSALCVSLFGCASAGPPPSSSAAAASPPADPASAAPVETAAGPKQSGEAEAAAQAEKSASPPPAEQPGDGLRKASRPPIELLTGNNVVFMFNFASSAIGASAKERCDGQNDDRAAASQCLAKERGKIQVESVRFVKDASGQYWWVTFNRYKGNLLKWHKVQFYPGKQDTDTVSLTLTGKDKGIAPMPRVPASLKIELPNDYSIIISDPDHGAMLYDAKIGLMDPE